MTCLYSPIYYPTLTPDQNAYLKELRDSYTANGCDITEAQQDHLDTLFSNFQVVTEQGAEEFELVIDEAGNTSPLKLTIGPKSRP